MVYPPDCDLVLLWDVNNMVARFSHLAVVVRSVEKAAAQVAEFDVPVGPAEDFEAECTREIYVGNRDSHSGLLLLVQPIGDGPYRRAINKRGPGIHHLALDVASLEAYIHGLSGSGWLLHPASVETIKRSRTAYLARPGIPLLVEAQETQNLSTLPPLISGVGLPIEDSRLKMFDYLGVAPLILHASVPRFSMNDHVIEVATLA